MYRKSLILLACLGLTACGSKEEFAHKEPPPVPVLAVVPAVKDVPVYLESIGNLQPSVFMQVLPQVNGTLKEVFITEGQWVQQGTPLFKIDTKPYAIKVQEAGAQLALDRASLASAQKKLERYKSLAQKDLLAQTEWDELETQVEKAQATVQADEARLSTAQLDLDRCTILSPIEGRVGKLDAHPGLLVSSSQSKPLVTVSKMDPLLTEFTVTEKEFPNIPLEKLEIELQPLCSKACPPAKGTVTFFDNHFDDKSGLLLVRAKVPNPQHALRPGQSVRVRLPIGVTKNAKLIPQKAVKYSQQGPYVYIVQADKTVGFRQVITGDTIGDQVIVLEGLDASEPVITDGHLRLSPGVKVEIKS